MARRAGLTGEPRRLPRADVLLLLAAIVGTIPALGGQSTLGALVSDGGPLGAGASAEASSPIGGSPAVASPGVGSSGLPGASSVPVSSPRPTPQPTAVTVRVASIAGLLSTLQDDRVDVIVVADGRYHVSPSNEVAADSFWIGAPYAARTRPVTVRAETPGGVVFDGSGGRGYGGLSFEDGAHDQTWDGFVFADMAAEQSGIIEVGGYVARRTPHHITLRNITIERSCTGSATSADAPAVDHAVYISNALDVGPHDLLFENITVDGRGGLASAVHFDHGTAADPNATGVVVRGLQVTGTQQAIILWQPPVHEITFDQVRITDALSHAIRFESIGATNVVFSNITSTGTGGEPFLSSLGSDPPGLTLIDDSLH